jgi:hypothetical protein
MKIAGWDCVIGTGGTSRAASHPENGTLAWVQGRLIGACDCPPEVAAWVLRAQLADVWHTALRCAEFVGSTHLARQGCPFDVEPPSKDDEPS